MVLSCTAGESAAHAFCSLVLLAIAFSIYIRVINIRKLLLRGPDKDLSTSASSYQRRGLMFDVFSIQFSRYGPVHGRHALPGALHAISIQEWPFRSAPGRSSHAELSALLKKPRAAPLFELPHR